MLSIVHLPNCEACGHGHGTVYYRLDTSQRKEELWTIIDERSILKRPTGDSFFVTQIIFFRSKESPESIV